MSIARRGRPKSSIIPELMREGELGNGTYKCQYCLRLFPRMKSLNAHTRIHTGETPYLCTYPGCGKNFKQSGQLKTHVRRHTGEMPFACKVSGCPQRYLHSSRKCTNHPAFGLAKDNREVVKITENHTEAEIQWLNEYKQNKGKPVKRKISTNSLEAIRQLNTGKSNSPTPSSPSLASGYTSSSGFSSCSEASRDSNSSSSPHRRLQGTHHSHQDQSPQAEERRFFMLVDPKALEAAEILCSFSKMC